MADDVVKTGIFVEISGISKDYDYGSDASIHSIKFYPGAANDVLVIFNKAVGLAEGCKLMSVDAEPRIEYFEGNIWWPVIDFSASTLSANHKVIIVLDRVRK